MNFATKRAAFALTGAAAWFLSGTAQAQDTMTTKPSNPFRVKVGGWIPSSARAQRAYSYSILSFGAGYDVRHSNKATPNVYEAYFDYFKRPKTSGGIRREAELYGIGLSDRIYLTPRGESYSSYVGAGVGVYHIRTKQEGATGIARRYKTGIGGKFLAGTELHGGVFGEVEYAFVPEPKLAGERVKLSGTQIRLGYRF